MICAASVAGPSGSLLPAVRDDDEGVARDADGNRTIRAGLVFMMAPSSSR
jgi:hypothetical protein